MKRVVSTIASATEIVCALRLEAALVGRSHECDYPPSVKALPVCTNTLIDAAQSSAEIDRRVKAAHAAGEALYFVDKAALARVRPDVILTQSHCDVCAVNQTEILRALHRWGTALPAVVSLAPLVLADVWESIRQVAVALEVGERGEALVRALQSRLAAVAEQLPAPEFFPRVAYLEWIEPPMAGGNWMPELIAAAGGKPVLGRATGRSAWVTVEEIVAAQPEVVLVAPCGFDLARTEREAPALLHRPEWKRLPRARFVLMDGNQYFNRPGPRLADSVEMLAEIFHPARFFAGRFRAAWRQAVPG